MVKLGFNTNAAHARRDFPLFCVKFCKNPPPPCRRRGTMTSPRALAVTPPLRENALFFRLFRHVCPYFLKTANK